MLRPCAVTVFVRPDTIEQVERYFAEDSDVFAARTEIVEDHRGESGTLCRLFTAGAEVELAPFNHFHYRYDFEIGLTIDANHRIHDLEGALANHGYDFESGFFDDEHREYFLIPRKQGVFTPFAVASYQNTQSNPYLDSVRRVRVELPRENFATTEYFFLYNSMKGL